MSMVALEASEAKALIEVAKEAMAMAYAPYSRFRVGAAVLTESGNVYRGCNVENASFGGTICAERAAVCSAVTHGERQFQAIAVVTDHPEPVGPCGICRQFIAEFGLDTLIVCANLAGEYDIRPISYWLPGAFTGTDLPSSGPGAPGNDRG